MATMLIIGASGFIGRHLAHELLRAGYQVRGLARDTTRVQELVRAGGEAVPGDMTDFAAVQQAVRAVQAVYICVHTLSPQPGAPVGQRFMAIEQAGVQNVLRACQAGGVPRVIYVTSLGTAPDAPSEWLRERWHTEQLLLCSDLAATVIRPGFIVGVGGGGFDRLVQQVRQSLAPDPSGSERKVRPIALTDLLYYLVGILDEPRTYGHGYDVGNEETLTSAQLAATLAGVLNQADFPPLPLVPPAALAPPGPHTGPLPEGALAGFLDSRQSDMIGNPLPIRQILPHALLSFKQAVEQALMRKG